MRLDRARAARAGAVAVALTALVALVALASRETNPLGRRFETGSGPSHTFFDTAYTLLLLFELACFVAFVWALMRVRPDPDRVRPVSLWLRSFVTLAASLVVASLIGAHFLQQQRHRPQLPAALSGRSRSQEELERLQRQQQGRGYVPHVSWIVVALVLGAAGAAVTAAAVARRRRRGEPLPSLPEKPADAIAADVGDTIDDLRSEPDPRRAIVAAYARMERSLAAHGFARRAWEAPLEYLTRVLLDLRARAEPVRRLTDLFEHAKFAAAEPSTRDKEDAIEALVRIRDDLRSAG